MTEDCRTDVMPWSILLGASSGLVGACLWLARIENLVEAPRTFLGLFGVAFVCYGAGLWALARLRGRLIVAIVLSVAALCRLVLLPSAPTLSTDAYRYVWDARVARAGVSPYAAAPNDPALAHLRDAAIYAHLNHSTWRTIYPPGAQLFFRAVYALAPDSVIAMKLAIALAELATLVVLACLLGRLAVPLEQLAVYAWNPLLLLEIWGSGHLDGLVILFVVAAVYLAVAGRVMTAAMLLGLGTLVKIYPVILLPLLLDGAVAGPLGAFALVVIAGYAPLAYLGGGALGSLSQYVSTEYFNPGLVRTLIDAPTATLTALGAWIVFASLWRRGASLVDRSVTSIGGFIVLGPNIFPWYALWLIPFLAIRPLIPWIVFTGTLALAYTFFLSEPWAIPAWARLAEFLPLAIGGIWVLGERFRANRTAPEPCPTSLGESGGQP